MKQQVMVALHFIAAGTVGIIGPRWAMAAYFIGAGFWMLIDGAFS